MEKIITESISFDKGTMNETFTFTEIQKYLDEGYTIKNIFYTPRTYNKEVAGISITVLLVRAV